MDQTNDVTVRVNGNRYRYPCGTPYKAIAEDLQPHYPHQILLVNQEGKLCELSKHLERDCSLSMVTAADKPGLQTYERSAVLLMLKSFYDVVGRAQYDRLHGGIFHQSRPVHPGRGTVFPGSGAAGTGRGTDAGADGPGPPHSKALCQH